MALMRLRPGLCTPGLKRIFECLPRSATSLEVVAHTPPGIFWDLRADEAAANAALMSKSASKPPPTNALRRRLDAANPNLASNPMLHHGKGAPEPEPIAGERPKTFYGGYNPADTVNNFGEEVCYEERVGGRGLRGRLGHQVG